MYIYTEGIDRMTDRYKYINKGLQIDRRIYYTSRERSIDIDRHRHHTHSIHVQCIHVIYINVC